MSKRIENLKDLFIEQGRELYDASLQEQKELLTIEKHVSDDQLRKIINRQLTTSKNQSNRIESAFKKINTEVQGEKSDCCQAVFRKTQSLIDRSKDPKVRDAAIINSIQRLSHNKITGFGALTSYAKEIGHQDIAHSFHETLEEEKTLDRELSDLAQNEINKRALTGLLA